MIVISFAHKTAGKFELLFDKVALGYRDSWLWIIYIGKLCKQNRQRQWHETVFALATLGNATKNRNNPISVLHHPRWL